MSALAGRLAEIDSILYNQKGDPVMQTENRYTASPRVQKQIETNFVYHPSKAGQEERYKSIRAKAKELAELIVACTPESREQSVALTSLEEVVMWANAAIARNESQTPTI